MSLPTSLLSNIISKVVSEDLLYSRLFIVIA